jgi:NAD(P)-dependent dehydrogenase (short-subunit alcohol dehydrogenase family)
MASFGFETSGDEVVEWFRDPVVGRTCLPLQVVINCSLTLAVLITGPSPDGIGAETAYCLAKSNPKLLILAGRSQPKIQPVIDRLRQQGIPVFSLPLDLSSQKSIRNAVELLEQQATKIDVLINNAAITACPHSVTEDGIELQFATNFVGPFLFTTLLLKAGLIIGRIVNVNSSASVRKASYVLPPLDDITYGNGSKYDPVQAYSVSKTASLLFTRSLAFKLRNRGITAFSLNPGSIRSPLQRYLTDEVGKAMFEVAYRENPDFVPPVRKTVQQGCSTQLRAALDPSLNPLTGAYLDDCQVHKYWQHVEAHGAADKVWKIGEDLVGEKSVL